jgi:hypothetical protein
MTHKKNNIHFAPHEDTCFDIMIGISGWIFGFIEGTVMGLILLCSEKKSEDDLVNEIEVFVYEMGHGYSTGKKDTKYASKLL